MYNRGPADIHYGESNAYKHGCYELTPNVLRQAATSPSEELVRRAGPSCGTIIVINSSITINICSTQCSVLVLEDYNDCQFSTTPLLQEYTKYRRTQAKKTRIARFSGDCVHSHPRRQPICKYIIIHVYLLPVHFPIGGNSPGIFCAFSFASASNVLFLLCSITLLFLKYTTQLSAQFFSKPVFSVPQALAALSFSSKLSIMLFRSRQVK